MASKPTNGGIVAAAIIYMRLFLTCRVYIPTITKITTEVTVAIVQQRMTFRMKASGSKVEELRSHTGSWYVNECDL